MPTNQERGLPLRIIAELVGAMLPPDVDPDLWIRSGASLQSAEPWHVSFMEGNRHAAALRQTRAGACLVNQRDRAMVPWPTAALVVADPKGSYARLLGEMHPETLRPAPVLGNGEAGFSCHIHPTAVIEENVILDPGVVIGECAVIGAGTMIGAHSVVGPGVVIGRDCSIAPGVVITHCHMGNRVILHPGVRIGQDGFGYAAAAEGHRKVPQLGRVIIGQDVEIGANTTIDRGSADNTVIGQGTKIDNLVQIAHNVHVGHHCVIVAQVGIAGSTILEDYVVVGGQAAIADHLHIGKGAQLGAAAGLMHDMPAQGRWAGLPAKPVRAWFREQATLARLARPRPAARKGSNASSPSLLEWWRARCARNEAG